MGENESITIYSNKHKACGTITNRGTLLLSFDYQNKQVELPVRIYMDEHTKDWLIPLAILQMDSYIDNQRMKNSLNALWEEVYAENGY